MPKLSVFVVVLTALQLAGQNVEPYYLAVVNAPASDSTFNHTIDEIWTNVMQLDIDTSSKVSALRNTYEAQLYDYYLAHPGESTGEKALLFHFFVLLRNQDYTKILARFPDPAYSSNLWIALYPIFKRAFLVAQKADQPALRAELARIQSATKDSLVQTFLLHQFDLAVGEKAPLITKRDLSDQLVDTKGKVVLIDFWATWCKPCIAELPTLKKLQETYQEDDRFMIISISRDDDVDQLKRFVKKKGMNWTHIHDGRKKGGELAYAFRVQGIPKYYLIDQKGIIRFNSDLVEDRSILKEKVAELLE